MKIITIILITFSAVLLLLIITVGWLGLFSTVNVSERVEGGYTVVGNEFIGDYMNVGKQMKDIDSRLKAAGLNSTKGFGIYYDNPKVTPKNKCRSFIGDIIELKDMNRIEDFKKAGFKVDTIAKKMSVLVEFPVKNQFSYFIGPIKAYPAINKYMKAKNYKPILTWELYDTPNKKIYYIMQL